MDCGEETEELGQRQKGKERGASRSSFFQMLEKRGETSCLPSTRGLSGQGRIRARSAEGTGVQQAAPETYEHSRTAAGGSFSLLLLSRQALGCRLVFAGSLINLLWSGAPLRMSLSHGSEFAIVNGRILAMRRQGFSRALPLMCLKGIPRLGFSAWRLRL